jgi:membrane protease YdiL (CAAX protease family)
MEPEIVPAATASHPLRKIFFNDRGLRAVWRLLIFLAILYAFSRAIGLVVHLLSKKLKQPVPTNVLDPQFQIIGDGVAFLLLLLATFIMSRIERRSLGTYGLPIPGHPVLRRLLAGYLFLGFLPLTLCLFVMHLFHAFSFGSLALHGGEILKFGAEWMIAFFLVGLFEEYLLRGYTLYTLADGVGFWPAAIVMAVLFGLGHSGNSGETRIGLIATVVFALFASVTLRYTGSLWLAVGSHAGWDWGQSFFYGVSDSGIRAQGHLLDPSFHGPDWLTGGSVGPEGSVITLVLWALMTVAVILIYRRRGPALVVTPVAKDMPPAV